MPLCSREELKRLTWQDIIAELLLICHALLDKALAQPDIISILNLLPEEFFLALKGNLSRMVPLHVRLRLSIKQFGEAFGHLILVPLKKEE